MVRKLYAGLVTSMLILSFGACKPQKKSSPPADENNTEDVIPEEDPGIIPAPGEITPVEDPPYNPDVTTNPEIKDTNTTQTDTTNTTTSTGTQVQESTRVSSVDLGNLAGNKVFAINASGQADWLSLYQAGEYILVWGALGDGMSLTGAARTRTNPGDQGRQTDIADRSSKVDEVRDGEPTIRSDDFESKSLKDITDNIVSSKSNEVRGAEPTSRADEFETKSIKSLVKAFEEKQSLVKAFEEKQSFVQRAKLKFSELKESIAGRFRSMTDQDKARIRQVSLVAALASAVTLIIALPVALASKNAAIDEALSAGRSETAACLESQECVILDGEVLNLNGAATLEELTCLYEPKVDDKGDVIVENGKTVYSCNIVDGKVVGKMNKKIGAFAGGDGGDVLLYDRSECVKNFGTEQTCQQKAIRLSDMKSAGVQTIVGVLIDPATGQLSKKWVSVRGEVLQPGS